MLRLPIMLLFAFLVACGRGGILQGGTLEIPHSTGNWFCQPAAGGGEWDCIQDEQLARSPQLAAPSSPATEGAGERPEAQPPEPEGIASPPQAAEQPQAVESSAAGAPAAGSPAAGSPAAESTEPQTAAAPDAGTDPLMALPDDYYAVQLVALDSAAELSSYVAAHGLDHLPHARVERDGRIHYVLLLGFYESYALAEAASLDPPPPLQPGEAWIRPLAGLKRAVERADSLGSG